ncbi:hypothetical protein BHE74_00008092, partial [Ensete ventricosum]
NFFWGSIIVVGSTAKKHPSVNEGLNLRRHSKRVTHEQPADASGGTTRSLCEVEDWAGADKYFASIMTRLKTVEGEDPLIPRWFTINGSNQGLHFVSAFIDRVHDAGWLVRTQHERIWCFGPPIRSSILASQELVAAVKFCLNGLEEDVNKLGARGRSQSPTLQLGQGSGPKAVAAYKMSRGFESGLEKMGRVSYEFGYRMTLERLRGKHSEIEIE